MPKPAGNGLARRAHFSVLIVLQSVMAVELALLIGKARWMHVFLLLAVMAGTLAPEQNPCGWGDADD